jgi:hypothetical protein
LSRLADKVLGLIRLYSNNKNIGTFIKLKQFSAAISMKRLNFLGLLLAAVSAMDFVLAMPTHNEKPFVVSNTPENSKEKEMFFFL